MEKNILKYFLGLILLLPFCNSKRETELEKVSNNVWSTQSKDSSKKNILLISLHKNVGDFTLYWIKFRPKPVKIQEDLKKTVEIIDNKSIFLNKYLKEVDDYKHLVANGLISLSKSQTIDDSLDGFLYIGSIDTPKKYKLVPLVEYYETLHEKRIALEKSNQGSNIEERLYLDVVNYFWAK